MKSRNVWRWTLWVLGLLTVSALTQFRPATVAQSIPKTTRAGAAIVASTSAMTLAQGDIAFTSNRDGNAEIYVMKANGSDQTRLTKNAAEDFHPAWSPSGRQIAFVSTRDGNEDIYVMNADGSGQTRLTSNAAVDYEPAWSPNGRQLVFASQRDGNIEIYAMNADGTGQTRLTDSTANDAKPMWSPDGRRIAFHSNRDGNYEIYVMNADGTSPNRRPISPRMMPSRPGRPTASASPSEVTVTATTRST